jgi:hypothetical protein
VCMRGELIEVKEKTNVRGKNEFKRRAVSGDATLFRDLSSAKRSRIEFKFTTSKKRIVRRDLTVRSIFANDARTRSEVS